jgi:hypothetical protein
MKDRIQAIAKLFNSTHQLIIRLDLTAQGDDDIVITKSDKNALHLYYNLYDMKRFNNYWLFEDAVKDYALKRNLLPTSAAMELCQAANKINIENGN